MCSRTIVPLVKDSRNAPSPGVLVRHFDGLSQSDTQNVLMSVPHFQNRMVERDITVRQVLEVLRTGNGINTPEKDEFGDWRISMRRKVAGQRVHVVVAVCESYVECITTW